MSNITVLPTGPLWVNSCIVDLTNDAVFVVDPAACEITKDECEISDYILKNKKRLVAIILTHGHFDHIMGLSHLKKQFPSCPIVIHKNDSHALGGNGSSSQIDLVRMMGMNKIADALKDTPCPDYIFYSEENMYKVKSFIDNTITERRNTTESFLTLDFILKNETEVKIKQALSDWQIIFTPGHSEGSVCLYNQKLSELISGDTIFYHSYGRTDLPGSDDMKMQKTLLMLQKMIPPKTKVYPGHDKYGFDFCENY